MQHIIQIAIPNTGARPATTGEVERYERRNMFEFPPELRSMFLADNGGVPVKCVLCPQQRRIVRYLGLYGPDVVGPAADHYSLHAVSVDFLGDRLSWSEDEDDTLLVPFAELFAGDYLCLDYRASEPPIRRNPRVVVWLHELSEEFHPVVEIVADSFSEFLGRLS